MDPVDVVGGGAAAAAAEEVVSTGESRQVVNKKNQGWHKRLRLRKAAVQPPAMQSRDKHGPKKITEEECEHNADECPSSKKKPPREARPSQRGGTTNDSGNVLRFRCSQCKDSLEFVPGELVRHFKETHKAHLPVFPCHVCSFSAHEFSYLQVHLLSHKDTFSGCSICNDNVQRTLAEFSTHLTAHHSQNGKYSCKTCQKFSTGDVRVFLEHSCLHSLTLEQGGGEVDCAGRTFRCQYCGYEDRQKKLITKHIDTVHAADQSGDKRAKKVHSGTVRPNNNNNDNDNNVSKRNHRLTRNTARWLSQDCLSLPGREFLDKYCGLSDPAKTLEETQQFLVTSTVGETAAPGQKWTKALQTVVSNVPQQDHAASPHLAGHLNAENCVTNSGGFPNSSQDFTVLTVKNKITVPQNGAYAKGFRMMPPPPPSEKQEAVHSESADVDTSQRTPDTNGCQSNINDEPHCAGTPIALHDDASVTVQNEPSQKCSQLHENRENRVTEADQASAEEHRKKQREEPQNINPCEDRMNVSGEPKPLLNERGDKKSVSKARPKSTFRTIFKRKGRPRKDKRSPGALGLKIVLKKNPVKEKQWVSQQSPLSLLGSDLLDNAYRLPHPHTTLEETQQFLQSLSAENGLKPWIKTPTTAQQQQQQQQQLPSEPAAPVVVKSEDPLLAVETCRKKFGTSQQSVAKTKVSVPPGCTTQPIGFKMVDGKKLLVLKMIPSAKPGMSGETTTTTTTQPSRFIELEVDDNDGSSSSAGGTTCLSASSGHSSIVTPAHVPPQNSDVSHGPSGGSEGGAVSCRVSGGEESSVVNETETLGGNYEAEFTSPVLEPPLTPQVTPPSSGDEGPPGLTPLPPSEQSDLNGQQGKRKREPSSSADADYCPHNNNSPLRKANPASTSSSQTNPEEEEEEPSSSSSPPAAPAVAGVDRWQPAPKGAERTLTLLPLNPAQLIKRPTDDLQPVVVLNHPDADAPEVTNIMEAVHRYKGEIRKVVLSRKTLRALSATATESDGGGGGGESETTTTTTDTDAENPSSPPAAAAAGGGHAAAAACLQESTVQERFVLKLRLRRVSLKKYQVVSTASHGGSGDVPVKFRCWFCGRVFASQEVWMRHRQRHLIESESPNCEKSLNVAHTG